MSPIKEEDQINGSVDREEYVKILKKIHSALKNMKIGVSQKLVSPIRLNEIMEDIEAIKAGNYIIVNE